MNKQEAIDAVIARIRAINKKRDVMVKIMSGALLGTLLAAILSQGVLMFMAFGTTLVAAIYDSALGQRTHKLQRELNDIELLPEPSTLEPATKEKKKPGRKPKKPKASETR